MNPPLEEPRDSKAGLPFYCILAAFALYAAAFISRTSFEIGGVRYFCLFDDAMISMRYAKNLAAGMGLVWNPGGERVEGFTNPLWVLWMTLFHLFPIPPSKISLVVQISGAVCLVLTLVYTRRIALLLAPGSRTAEYSAVLLTGFYVPLVNWTLQGMEVGVLTLMATWSVWTVLRSAGSGRVPRSLFVVLGLMTLVRIDTAMPAAVILACVIAADPRRRRAGLLLGGSILAFCLAAQTVFRYAYYGEFLPNTYFLKMTGVPLSARLHRGGSALADFAAGMTWIVFLFPFAGVLLRRNWKVSVLAILFLMQCAYSVYVGGDAWEWWGGSNRYIAIAMPLFFVLFGYALAGLKSLWDAMPVRESRVRRYAWRGLTCLVLVIAWFEVNNVTGSVPPSDWMRAGKLLASAAVGNSPNFGLRETAEMAEWLVIPMPLEMLENERMVRAALLLDSVTAPGARVAVVLAGALPYFSHRTFIDILGKNDSTVARLAGRATIDPRGKLNYTPGHSKWSYAYSIGDLKPDVVCQLWRNVDEAQPFLTPAYREVKLQKGTWYFLRGSTKILWDALAGKAIAGSAPAP